MIFGRVQMIVDGGFVYLPSSVCRNESAVVGPDLFLSTDYAD